MKTEHKIKEKCWIRLVAILLAQSPPASSSELKLTGNNASLNDSFGRSVAIDGTTIIIGADDAIIASPSVFGTGSAYVYHHNGWTWEQQATLPKRLLQDCFYRLRFHDGVTVFPQRDEKPVAVIGFAVASWLQNQLQAALQHQGQRRFLVISDGLLNVGNRHSNIVRPNPIGRNDFKRSGAGWGV